jgi:hypothetical protein
MASDQASGQESARAALLRRRVGGSINSNCGRTWAPVGKTPIVRVTGKRASVLVMSALSLQGRLFFKIPSERVNATVFMDFLKELLAEYPKRKIFVIADQASPHIAKSVKAFVAGQKRLTSPKL